MNNLRDKYHFTAPLYDILDAPWERIYRTWRPRLCSDLKGKGVEAGVGTGRNLPFYQAGTQIIAVDQSPEMIHQAKKRKRENIQLEIADACNLPFILDSSMDFYLSTFMYCVLPHEKQKPALDEMVRILKDGAPFRILEIIFSQKKSIRLRQKIISPLVQWIYGAQFNRQTLTLIQNHPDLEMANLEYLKDDTYLLIEGIKSSK